MKNSYEEMQRRWNENIHYDEQGNPYVLDENGNRRKPMYCGNPKKSSGFTYYDTPGYCGLCGMADCRGECFQPGF